MSTSTAPPTGNSGGGTRVANLRLRRIDPWSAMKTGFVFAIGLGIAYVIAGLLLYLFSDLLGVFDSFNNTFSELTGESAFSFSFFGVLAAMLVFAVIEIIVTTLLFAVLAMLYNAAASATGGILLKLGED